MNASNIDHVPRIFLPRWIPTNVGTISKDTRTSLAAELQDTFESHFSDWKKEQSLSALLLEKLRTQSQWLPVLTLTLG